MTKRPKSSHSNQPNLQQATKLAALARRVTEDFDDPRYERWDDELDAGIRKALRAGNDALLAGALTVAVEKHELGVFEELRDTIASHATSRPVLLTGEEVGFFTLYAMPVLSIRAGGLSPKRRSITGAALGEIARSFRKHGLVRHEASVLLCEYLFHPEELDALSFLQVHRLVEQLIEQASGKTPRGALTGSTGWPQDPDKTPGQPRLELRYLLVCVLDDANAPEPFMAPLSQDSFEDVEAGVDGAADDGKIELSEEEEQEIEALVDAHFEKVETWMQDVTPTLSRVLKHGAADVLFVQEPQPYYAGLQSGLASYWSFGMLCSFRSQLAQHDIAPRGAWALVMPVGEDDCVDEFRVSLLSVLENKLIAGFVRPLLTGEEADDVLESLTLALNDLGLLRCEVSSEVHEAMACEGCGRPTYLTPNGLEHNEPGGGTPVIRTLDVYVEEEEDEGNDEDDLAPAAGSTTRH